MKKSLLILPLFCLLVSATACKSYDYRAHLSDVREEIFLAETEEFSLSLSCISREKPFLTDGIAAERSNYVEIVLTPVTYTGQTYEVEVLGDTVWGGEMSFRNVSGDYVYSKGVETFPEKSVSLRILSESGESVVTATGVKTEATLGVNEILNKAIEAEREKIDSLTENGVFRVEFHVRLLRRDKNYYYVGIVDQNGKILSLLLDSETGEVLARREN